VVKKSSWLVVTALLWFGLLFEAHGSEEVEFNGDEEAFSHELYERQFYHNLAEDSIAFELEMLQNQASKILDRVQVEVEANLNSTRYETLLQTIYDDWVEDLERERKDNFREYQHFAEEVYREEFENLSDGEMAEIVRFTRSNAFSVLAYANARILSRYFSYQTALNRHPALIRFGQELLPVVEEIIVGEAEP
jgi:hypothetical protein